MSVDALTKGTRMIQIPESVYQEMIDHAKKSYPQEACGFVAGKDGLASYFIPMENIDRSSVTYSMNPKEQLHAFKRMEKDQKDLLGIFHSHVASPAEPSRKDKELAFYPDVSYLIVSMSDMDKPSLRSFKITEGEIKEEEIVLL